MLFAHEENVYVTFMHISEYCLPSPHCSEIALMSACSEKVPFYPGLTFPQPQSLSKSTCVDREFRTNSCEHFESLKCFHLLESEVMVVSGPISRAHDY